MNTKLFMAIVLVALAFFLAFYMEGYIPEKMASHWNASGDADGYMPKAWGLFLMPLISLALLALFAAIPRIDPLGRNIAKFRAHYDNFVVLVLAFLLYLHILSLAWNLGVRFDFGQALAPAFAALFYYAGVLIGNAERNWFVGIRTPWTMSSEGVWRKTHALGGRIMKACAALALLGAVFPAYAIWLVVVPALLFAGWAFVYSYLEYRRETEGRSGKARTARRK